MLPKNGYTSDPKNPLLYQLLMERGKSDSFNKVGSTQVDALESKPRNIEPVHESSGLSSLKGFPPLPVKKEIQSDPEFSVLKEDVYDRPDVDSDIIETFDVISDDSEEISKPVISTKEAVDEYLNDDFSSDVPEPVSELSKKELEPSKIMLQEDVSNEPMKTSEGLTSLKGLPKLKLAPLKRDLAPLDPLKKPSLIQINKETLENQLETDAELQETFNRLQNDSLDAVAVEPLDLTEDISLEEEYNQTEDISEIHTTDRSVSPRFVSSVSGHDLVEECRPK